MVAQERSGQTPSVASIVGSTDVRLFGLTGAERIERQLRALGVTRFVREQDAATSGPLLLVRGDHLFDVRILRELLASPVTILEITDEAGKVQSIAANVAGDHVAAARKALQDRAQAPRIDGVSVQSSATLRPSYIAGLLKADRPLVLPIRTDRAADLESFLFSSSYKGVTDLVTKWVWPAPAQRVVKICAQMGISPNAVTSTGFACVVGATWLFSQGHFGAGLILAWIMTFLDTVDGKLARVTITSSPFGHFLDHGTDLVHPPVWYAAWGAGLVGGFAHLAPLATTLEWILAGYIGGRLIEAAFRHLVAGFSMFTWRAFDSYFRLVTGRRNPNLLLLTGFYLSGQPAEGLTAVAVWTVASTAILGFRLVQGALAKARGQRMSPWLEDIDPDCRDVPRYAQPFAPDGTALARLTR